MATPKVSRRNLRKRIGKSTGMRFFRLFDESSALDVGSTVSSLIDSALTQPDGYWKDSWYYQLAGSPAGDVRLIIGFDESNNRIIPDRDLSTAPETNGDATFQIFDIFSPLEIHAAINDAIREGSQFFFGTGTEQPIATAEDRLEYTLSGFTNSPWKVLKLWVEQPSSVISSDVSSAASTTVTLPSGIDLTSVTSNYVVVCYAGTGSGEWQSVSSVSGQVITTGSWTTTLDSTSKVRVYDTSKQTAKWRQITAANFSPLEHPSTLYLTPDISNHSGYRIRFQFIYKPSDLTSDTDTTIVPEDYVFYKALSLLFKNKTMDTRVDRGRYENDAQDFERKALEYALSNSFTEPSGTVWQFEELSGNRGFGSYEDPLGWLDG